MRVQHQPIKLTLQLIPLTWPILCFNSDAVKHRRKNHLFTVILPGYICCIKRAGSTLHWVHWVAWLDSTTECIYSTCCIHNCMHIPLVPDRIRVPSCVWCLFWTNRNSMAVTSIFLFISSFNKIDHFFENILCS